MHAQGESVGVEFAVGVVENARGDRGGVRRDAAAGVVQAFAADGQFGELEGCVAVAQAVRRSDGGASVGDDASARVGKCAAHVDPAVGGSVVGDAGLGAVRALHWCAGRVGCRDFRRRWQVADQAAVAVGDAVRGDGQALGAGLAQRALCVVEG